MDIINLKKKTRTLIKVRKASLSREQKMAASAKIFSMVEGLPQFKSAQTVLAYWSLPDEVHTHVFVEKWHREKRMLLPLVVENKLILSKFSGPQSMVETLPFGILEPIGDEIVDIDEVDIVVVPGMAFDNSGNRLGRGKGYYDKLLTDKRVYKVGVCFREQLLEKVPVDNLDVPIDKVIYA